MMEETEESFDVLRKSWGNVDAYRCSFKAGGTRHVWIRFFDSCFKAHNDTMVEARDVIRIVV
jgi:hypothetical protein